jgi:hypothetical protein
MNDELGSSTLKPKQSFVERIRKRDGNYQEVVDPLSLEPGTNPSKWTQAEERLELIE